MVKNYESYSIIWKQTQFLQSLFWHFIITIVINHGLSAGKLAYKTQHINRNICVKK